MAPRYLRQRILRMPLSQLDQRNIVYRLAVRVSARKRGWEKLDMNCGGLPPDMRFLTAHKGDFNAHVLCSPVIPWHLRLTCWRSAVGKASNGPGGSASDLTDLRAAAAGRGKASAGREERKALPRPFHCSPVPWWLRWF